MTKRPVVHMFLLGRDYHLGDLLWLTAVLAAYRREIGPEILVVGCPDRPISRILEHNPLIDALFFGDARAIVYAARERYGGVLRIHNLRPLPLAVAMVRAWRSRLPWLYYRDLWLEVRGQWLATFLHLGRLQAFQPVLCLNDEDRVAAQSLACPYVAVAPHVGHVALPVLDGVWERLKGWDSTRWQSLVDRIRCAGYTPVTLAAAGEPSIPGTTGMVGLPIRQAAAVIERAEALVTVESGMWYVAAALRTPVVIVPWWLPRSVDWVAPTGVPYRLVPRNEASVDVVLSQLNQLIERQAGTRVHVGV
jgi:hypothetical protein